MEKNNDKQVQVSNTQAIASEFGYSRNQVQLMSDTFAKGADPDELRFFLQVCKTTGLDPFTRQIYMIKRNQKEKTVDDKGKEVWKTKQVMSIQMGIDGFRAQAQATGEYAGSDDAEFGPMVQDSYTDYNKKEVPYKHPEWAKVSVWGKGDVRPTSSTVYWDEFYPGDQQGSQWRKMPRQMLAKVAEAQSLRKRFPKALSGIYESSEMDQANDNPQDVQEQKEKQEAVRLNDKGQPYASSNQLEILYLRAAEKGYDDKDVANTAKAKTGKGVVEELTRDEAEMLIKGFDGAPFKKDLGKKNKSNDPDVQQELDTLEGEVVADKVPTQKRTRLTEEQEAEADAEIAKYKNREAE